MSDRGRGPIPQHRVPGASRGFTLIEVLIALTVAAISLGALTAAMSQMIDGSVSIRERTYASWVAQNHLAELRLANALPEVDTTTSEEVFANLEWRLETTVSETGVENLFRVDVSVSMVGEPNPTWEVSGFIGEPVQPGEGNAAWSEGFATPGAEE